MPNGTYGGVRGRKTKVGRKLLRFPPTRLVVRLFKLVYRLKVRQVAGRRIYRIPPCLYRFR